MVGTRRVLLGAALAVACSGPPRPVVDAAAAAPPPVANDATVRDAAPTALQFGMRGPGTSRGAPLPAAHRAVSDGPAHERPASVTTSLAIADVDGDGVLDLVSNPGRRLQALRGTGGVYADWTARWLPVVAGIERVRIAWFDGATPWLTTLAGGELGVLTPNVRLAFTDGAERHLAPPMPTGLRWLDVVDLDADGDRDLLVGGGAGLHVLELDAAARFVDRTEAWLSHQVGALQRFVPIDVDDDGRLDVLTCGATLGLLHQDRTHRLLDATAERLPFAFAEPLTVVAVDFERDRAPELVVLSQRGDVAIWRDVGDGHYVAADDLAIVDLGRGPWSDAVVADVDGDGRDDLVTAGPHGVQLLVHDADRWLRAEPWRIVDGFDRPVHEVRAIDIDDDLDIDLVLATDMGLVVLANDGHGRFVDTTAQRMPVIVR